MSEFLIDQAMREAIDLQNRNQLDDAKAIYQKIIVHDKNNSDAHHLISLIYFILGIITFYWSYSGAKDRGTLINIGE